MYNTFNQLWKRNIKGANSPWFNLTEENRVTERTVLNCYSVSELSQARETAVANLWMNKKFSVFYWILMRLFCFN